MDRYRWPNFTVKKFAPKDQDGFHLSAAQLYLCVQYDLLFRAQASALANGMPIHISAMN